VKGCSQIFLGMIWFEVFVDMDLLEQEYCRACRQI